jgi:hypothetical protein
VSTTTDDIEQDTSPEPVPAPAAEEAIAGRRWVRRSVLGASIVLVILGVTAAAASAYDRAHRDELLPGVRVNGRPVGGQEQAVVLRQLETPLSDAGRSMVRVTAGPATAALSLQQMGLHSDARAVMAAARADADHLGLAGRMWHRVLHKPVQESYTVRLHVDRNAVRDAMIGLGARVQRAPVDAKIDTSTGFVRIVPAVAGRSIDLTAATNKAFARGEELAAHPVPNGGTVDAPLLTSKPDVEGFADVLLVRTGENRLYHYENGNLVKTYMVATGQPKYPTPKGNFKIVLKRFRPVWINPDPTGWGASLPKSIPAGPGNPLGTRAMNLNAPGIRIHGTTNVKSLGTSASHGCIRMAMPDVEELFDLVDNGTPVIILAGAPAGAAPAAPTTAIGDPNAPVDLEAG